MSAVTRLFVSFCNRDVRIVRELLQRLSRSPLKVWDYSSPAMAVPVGAEIAAHLKERIVAADAVVVVVSTDSLSAEWGQWVRWELGESITAGFLARDRLLPIVVDGVDQVAWPAPFDRLRSRVFTHLQTAVGGSLDRAVSQLFQFFGVPRPPAPTSSRRLPVAEKVAEELRAADGRTLQAWLHNELVHLATRCEEAYAANRIPAALAAADSVLFRAADDAGIDLYYPLVVRGTCELQLGRRTDAEMTFRAALSHPRVDENAYGGLGLVLLAGSAYADARHCFAHAVTLAPDDMRARFNLALAERMSELPPTGLSTLRMEQFDEDERENVARLLASVAYEAGQATAAKKLLWPVVSPHVEADTAALWVAILLATNAVAEAESFLRGRRQQAVDADAWHRIARHALMSGDNPRAFRIYSTMLGHGPMAKRQYVVEHARALRACGRLREASQLCARMLDENQFGSPRSDADFYWDGFANFIAGRSDRANYDLQRARSFGPTYAAIMAQDLVD